MPAGPVGADFELRRERALGDLAVDGGPGQPGPGDDGFQTDDTIWFAHGRAASCWLFLTAAELDRRGRCGAQESFSVAVPWRRAGGKWDGSNSETPAPAEVEAMREGKFEAEPAACFEGDAKLPLAVFEDGFQLRIAFEASRHIAHRRAR